MSDVTILGASLASAWHYDLVIASKRRAALRLLPLLGKSGKSQISYHLASEHLGHHGCHNICLFFLSHAPWSAYRCRSRVRRDERLKELPQHMPQLIAQLD